MSRVKLPSSFGYNYSIGQSGNYQFTSLEEIIANFMVAYVGEDKIISRVKRLDVVFHAQRALAELSFDTLKSKKALEITVPNSLKESLPSDYVNYTKVAWVDDSGIEHNIYPTSKTSNPQFKGNLLGHDVSHLTYDANDWTLGTGFSWVNSQIGGGGIKGGTIDVNGTITSTVAIGTQIKISVPQITMGKTYRVNFKTETAGYSQAGRRGYLKAMLFGEKGHKVTYGYSLISNRNYLTFRIGAGNDSFDLGLHADSAEYEVVSPSDPDYVHEKCLVFEVIDESACGIIDSITVVELTMGGTWPILPNSNTYGGPQDSTTWDSYKSNTPAENNNDDYKDDTYWRHDGGRYGIDPQHAQINGSYYIDELTGFIHFSSNLSGKTIVLKYISDSLGTTYETIVHKFAEEAIYKWVMHAILSTRFGVPEHQVRRLKKERFAAIRQAKLRLSNIKLEELTQILRGKSKQIKH